MVQSPPPSGQAAFGPRPPFRRRLAASKLLRLGQGTSQDEVRRLRDLLAGHLDWAYGSAQRLPSDEEVARLFQASRNTVRLAFRLLSEEGRLIRTVGVGTYTTRIQPRNRFDRLVDPVTHSSNGADGEARLIGFKVTGDIPAVLADEFPNDTDRLSVYERLTLHNGGPAGLRTHYLALPRGVTFERDDALTDTYDVIEQRLGYRGLTARRNVSAIAADPSSARILQVRVGSPLLFIDTYVRNADGQLVMITHYRARSDRINVSIIPSRDPARDG